MVFEKIQISSRFYTMQAYRKIGSIVNSLFKGAMKNFELSEKILDNLFLKTAIFIILAVVFMNIHSYIGKLEDIKLEKRWYSPKLVFFNWSGYVLLITYTIIVTNFLSSEIPFSYTVAFGKPLLLFTSLTFSAIALFYICLKFLNSISSIFISYSKYVFLAPSLYILYRLYLFKIPLYFGLAFLLLFAFCIYICPQDTSFASALIRKASSSLLSNFHKIIPLLLLFALFFTANCILIIYPSLESINDGLHMDAIHITLFFTFSFVSQIFSFITCRIFENDYVSKSGSTTKIFKTSISQFGKFLVLSSVLSLVEFLKISWKSSYNLILGYNPSLLLYPSIPYILSYFLISFLIFQLAGLFTHFACFISIFKRRLDLITLKLVAKINLSQKFILFKCLMIEIWAPLVFSSLLSLIYNTVLGFEIPFSSNLIDFRKFVILLEKTGGFEPTFLLLLAFFTIVISRLFITSFMSSAMFHINRKLRLHDGDLDLSIERD